MGYYDVMQVCLKGHLITDQYNSYPQSRQDFCSKCGAKTIYKCPKCNTPIRGAYIGDNGIVYANIIVPYNCHKCGSPYPWAKRLKLHNSLKSLGTAVRSLIEMIVKIFKK